MKENGGGEYNQSSCYIHPKEVVIGICSHCLRERLVSLAMMQSRGEGGGGGNKDSTTTSTSSRRKKPMITLPRGVFALGSFLLRLHTRRPHHRPTADESDQGSIASLEDSFISIKFEENGEASWEESKRRKKMSAAVVAVEQTKPRWMSSSVVRWRKRIGQLLQLARRKRIGTLTTTVGERRRRRRTTTTTTTTASS